MKDLRYPIGKFEHAGPVRPGDLETWIGKIAALPDRMRDAVRFLDADQLDTEYRPGGWTIRQVVHHVPDSHLNCYVRIKMAITEDEPMIKPYDENGWSGLEDARSPQIEPSLDLLEALHNRWAAQLRSLMPEQLSRRFRHPETGLQVVDWNIGAYAWHGEHHLAHITTAIDRHGWRRG